MHEFQNQMKQTIQSGLAGMLAAVAALSASAAPRLVVAPEGVAFGEVAAGGSASRSVVVRNASPFPVAVSQVKGCCGAEVELSAMRLEPNASAVLTVSIRPKEPGEFSKQVRMLCDDPECPVVSVPVSGVVVAPDGMGSQETPPCERAVPLCAAALLCAGAACLLWKGRNCLSPPYCILSRARLAIGMVFVYAGAMKLCDVASFSRLISRYELLPDSFAGIAAVGLPAVEAAAGLMLVFTGRVRVAASAISAMLVAFIVALSQAAVRGLDVSCGCFGGVASSGLGWAIARDVAMFVPSLCLACRGQPC